MSQFNAEDIRIKREALKKAYLYSPSWAKRVNLMPPQQVVAVYLKFKSQNKI